MECTTVRLLLFRKIDGELSDAESAGLDAHLAECASCMREFRLYSLPARIAKAIPQPAPSSYFHQRLRMRIEGEARNAAAWQIFFRLAGRIIPAFACLTLALLCIFAYYRMSGPETDIYRAYEKAFMAEDERYQLLVAGDGNITDERVLRAIAERASGQGWDPDSR